MMSTFTAGLPFFMSSSPQPWRGLRRPTPFCLKSRNKTAQDPKLHDKADNTLVGIISLLLPWRYFRLCVRACAETTLQIQINL